MCTHSMVYFVRYFHFVMKHINKIHIMFTLSVAHTFENTMTEIISKARHP